MDDGYQRGESRAAADAMHEAKRAGLFFVRHRHNQNLMCLYAYNRIVGTIDLWAWTLTFPDPSRPVVRDVYPSDAVRMTWEDCRLENQTPDPMPNETRWAVMFAKWDQLFRWLAAA